MGTLRIRHPVRCWKDGQPKVRSLTHGAVGEISRKSPLEEPTQIARSVLASKTFHSDYESVFDNYDILLTPTLGTTTPKLGVFGPQIDGETHWQRIHEFLPFTKYQNISGAPAISLPCATDDDGLPIGIQLATRLGGDRLLLELSLQLEGSSAWNSIYNLHNTQNI